MKKDSLFVNGSGIGNGLSYRAAMDIHSSDQMIQASSSSEHNLHPNSFLTLNWVDNNNNPIDQRTLQFHSAMSSMVSSPTSPHINPCPESVAISELIGRLGSISNSEEFSPQSHTMGNYFGGNLSANTSCYSTPLNSPPKLNLGSMDYSRSVNNLPVGHQSLAQFAADPGFAERAARFSCIANRGFNGFPESELSYSGKLSRVSSSQCLTDSNGVDIDGRSGVIGNAGDFGTDRKFNRSSTPALEETELGIGREESSASDPAAGEINGKKRKAIPKGKAKEAAQQPSSPPNLKAAEDESRMKKSRDIEKEEMKPKTEESNAVGDVEGKQGKETSKPPEPPKDYIHVRARRGQATDSHSLAERVRREKISERMKFLQDLVPGCNKVTGKAVMLDEIINYVQSLQRQVEFLSMKLATVNPRLDLNMEGVLQKDMLQQRGSSSMVYPMDSCASAFPFPNHVQSTTSSASETRCSVNPLDSSSLRRSLSMHLPSADAFGYASSQLAAYFEDELQSIVQMGFGQNQEMAFSSENFHGSLPTSHMKIEL